MSNDQSMGQTRGFERLNAQISIRRTRRADGTQPTLVIVCAWLFAAPKHVLKYVDLYRQEIPHADILLIQPVVGDMVWTSDASQFKTLAPAVEVVNSFLSSSSPLESCIRFHVLSNAGSHAAVQLVEAYNRTYPEPRLCIHSLVLDSGPGSPSAAHSANAMILGLPRNIIVDTLGVILVYLVIAAVALLDALGASENVVSKTRRQLNDPGFQFLHGRVTRTYLYSKGDRMVPWKDILDHAKEAAERLAGTSAQGTVRIVEFAGSGHVGHLVVDAKKYRDAIFQG